MMITLLLISCAISSVYQGCYGQTTINVANGVYSSRVESDGLHLPATSTFRPIDALTLSHHFTSTVSVFVNYQITVGSTAQFWTKLQVTRNNDGLINAGSIVRYNTQAYKTATGYWMENLEPGHHTFEVQYKSTSSISMSTTLDYQTAILQVMWFTNARTVSDGVQCYPTPYPINTYDVFSSFKDLKVNLLVPSSGRVVIAGYQVSVYSSAGQWFTTRLHKNNQQLTSTIMTQGTDLYYTMNSLWMEYQPNAEYEFGVTYRNHYSSYFEDCRENYLGNKNLYAVYLPATCRILINLKRTGSLSLSSTSWGLTDLIHTITLNEDEHIFVRYQYSAPLQYSYIFTRLVINSSSIKHTASATGNDYYHGNSGMWQGILSSGRHTIAVEQRSGRTYSFSNNDYYTRAMDIIRCR